MLAAVAEMERHFLVERTQSSLARAKAKGKTLSRPTLTTDADRRAITEEQSSGVSISALAIRTTSRMRRPCESRSPPARPPERHVGQQSEAPSAGFSSSGPVSSRPIGTCLLRPGGGRGRPGGRRPSLVSGRLFHQDRHSPRLASFDTRLLYARPAAMPVQKMTPLAPNARLAYSNGTFAGTQAPANPRFRHKTGLEAVGLFSHGRRR
jgi:hypothetical protein